MIVGLALLAVGILLVPAPPRHAERFVAAGSLALVIAVVADGAHLGDLPLVVEIADRLDVLALAGPDAEARVLLLGAIAWCGPAADLVVRAVLARTQLPAPERAAAAGFRAGRWVGRLERWTLLVVVAAGQPALAMIPTGGKALLRYAEAVADARADRDRRLATPDPAPTPGRDAFLDYVLVGSLASWAQALVLGLLVAAA